jgi:hypothetical protein
MRIEKIEVINTLIKILFIFTILGLDLGFEQQRPRVNQQLF